MYIYVHLCTYMSYYVTNDPLFSLHFQYVKICPDMSYYVKLCQKKAQKSLQNIWAPKVDKEKKYVYLC